MGRLTREILGHTVHNPIGPKGIKLPMGPAALRLHDVRSRVQWHQIDDPSRYDGYDWQDMDRLADECLSHNLSWTDCILGTPQGNSSSVQKDAYGFVGGAGMPIDLSKLSAFVVARVTRYKSLISIIEPWNEPFGFFEPTTPPDPIPVGWKPDWSKAVSVAITVYCAAKMVNPKIRVTTPSMLGHHPNDWWDYILAGGMEWADDLAIHCYGHSVAEFEATLLKARDILGMRGYGNKGIALTECGHQVRWGSALLRMPEAERSRAWANCMLLAASYGCSAFVTYSEDPDQKAVDAGEVYPMNKIYAESTAMIRQYLGMSVSKATAWTATKPAWLIGGRRVVI